MKNGLALVALWALAACAKTVTPGSAPSAAGPIGYVRMDDVIKHHPLYPQLAQYDQNIDALTLGGTVPHALAGADVKRQQAEIAKELKDAADRTKALLDQKQKQYQDREAQAIQQALRASGVTAPGAGAVAAQVSQTAGVQSAGAARGAQRDFAAYQRSLAAQNESELDAMQRTVADRANRRYRAEQDELQAKEAALTLELANKDAAERLALKTKLSSLALDDAARQDARAKLDALDRSEADAVGAMKNRDTQTLVALQAKLRADVRAEMKTQAATINARSLAKLQSRESDLRREFAGPAVPATVTVATGKPGAAAAPGAAAQNLPPALRDRIAHLHADYQKQFTADAQATIDDFQKTRLDLSRRYAALGGADAAAGNDARDQIASLEHKRDELYGQMVEQIKREATAMAHQRGLAVVVSNPVAEIRGVDLTDDVAKDVETLHE
jgi:hypothetical protein